MFNIYVHFSVSGYSNSYFIGNDITKKALVVDPGHFDGKLLDKIEKNNFYITDVLVTHGHRTHIQGLKTLLKIYNPNVYYGGEKLNGIDFIRVEDEQTYEIIGTQMQPLSVFGHSRDSMVYKIQKNLFTGDVLETGRIGSTENTFLKARLIENIQTKILTLKGNYTIYPGHGPISTLEIERITFNKMVESEKHSKHSLADYHSL